MNISIKQMALPSTSTPISTPTSIPSTATPSVIPTSIPSTATPSVIPTSIPSTIKLYGGNEKIRKVSSYDSMDYYYLW